VAFKGNAPGTGDAAVVQKGEKEEGDCAEGGVDGGVEEEKARSVAVDAVRVELLEGEG